MELKSRLTAWTIVFLGLTGCGQTDQGEVSEPVPSGVVIPDSVEWNMASDISGQTYQIQLSLPLDYDSASISYPAVYLLDSNGQFGMTTEIVRNLTYFDEHSPGLIVVGVGYPVRQFFNAIAPRGLDLTPDHDDDWEEQFTTDNAALASRRGYPPIGPVSSGGAAAFLDFLNQELIPFVESEYRIEPARRTLIGHSLGGLFALYTLLEQPDSFEHYLVISPSLWWGCGDELEICQAANAPDGLILRREAELYEEGWSPSARVYLTVGSAEQAVMIEGPTRLAERLVARDYRRLDWTFEVLPNEWHMSIVPGAITTGLRWLYFGTPDV